MRYGYLILIFLISSIAGNATDKDTIRVYEAQFKRILKSHPDTLFLRANTLRNKAEEDGNNELIALSEMYIAMYYNKAALYNKALLHYQEAVDYFRKSNDTSRLALIYNKLGSFYRHVGEIDKSLAYYYDALAHTLDSDLELKADILNHLGDVHLKENHYDSANYYYRLSLGFSEPEYPSVSANNYNNLGDMFRRLSNYDSSEYYYLKSVELLKQANDPSELGENYSSLAMLNLQFDNSEKAAENLCQAIKILETGNFYYELIKAYDAGIAIYKKSGNSDSVAAYLEKQMELRDKLSKKKLKQSLTSIEIEHHLKQKENENSLLKKDNKLKNLTVSLLLSIVAIIVILIVFLIVRFRQKKKENMLLLRQKLKIEKQNEELKTAYDDIKELNATKDKFFSIISHDLKGPVTSMKLMIRTIMDDFKMFSDEELDEIFNEFYSQTSNTLDLLLTLLDWSRSQRGVIKYNFEEFPIYHLANSNINLLKNQADEKGIKLVNEIPIELKVFADTNTINTVIRNLISNALKFTYSGGTITIGYEVQNNEHIKIYIKDTGVGMESEIMNKLFKIDENITTLGTNNEKGTGLGLILCKDFVENNGGKIGVESTVGKGSVFYFSLPLKSSGQLISE